MGPPEVRVCDFHAAANYFRSADIWWPAAHEPIRGARSGATVTRRPSVTKMRVLCSTALTVTARRPPGWRLHPTYSESSELKPSRPTRS